MVSTEKKVRFKFILQFLIHTNFRNLKPVNNLA